MKKICVVLFILFCITGLNAQPPVEFMRMYHEGQREGFSDIYKVEGDGYVMSGGSSPNFNDGSYDMWIVRINNNGEELWSNRYGIDGTDDSAGPIIQADNGDFVTAGRSGNAIAALRVDQDGNEVWFRTYGRRYCEAIIELKSGEFLLCGRGVSQAFLLCIDGEGRVLWEHLYGNGGIPNFKTLREAQGGAVAAGRMIVNDEMVAWVVKANLENEGEIIWSNVYRLDAWNGCESMVSDGAGNLIIATQVSDGRDAGNNSVDFSLLKIDVDGDQQWWRRYNWGGFEGPENPHGVERMRDGGYAIVGHQYMYHGDNNYRPVIVRVDGAGELRWQRLYDFIEDDGFRQGPNGRHSFNSVVRGPDNSIITAGKVHCENDGTSENGLLIKLEPGMLEPVIFEWSPEDTLLTVLLADTVEFEVRARDIRGQELDYLWIMAEDTLSTDSLTTVDFNELGEHQLSCLVSNGNMTSTITWHVSVVEWFLQSFEPDSLDLVVRRGLDINFGLDVRTVEEVEPDYIWTLTDRNRRQQELGNAESVNVTFDLAGDHQIQGAVSHDGVTDEINWNVAVRSVIWWWSPRELQVSAEVETSIEFEVSPFNEESDSLTYSWKLDDDPLEIAESSALIPFSNAGEYQVMAFLTEGVESDSVIWDISISDINFIYDEDGSNFPNRIILYPPVPNPFNAVTRIGYQLPAQTEISIRVYDLSGREVALLLDGVQTMGQHFINWDAKAINAGIYFIRMESNGHTEIRTVVLVK